MKPQQAYTVYVDAQYVVNGLNAESNYYAAGTNGDLWTQIYDRRAFLQADITIVKVKSHVKDGFTYISHDMSPEKVLLNELADAAATHAVKQLCRDINFVAKDEATFGMARSIAKRLAIIETDVWQHKDELSTEIVRRAISDKSALFDSRQEAIKRHVVEAVANTSGEKGHSLIEHDGWIKCRHCPAQARSHSSNYWRTTPCFRASSKKQKPGSSHPIDIMMAQYHEYILHHPIELFDIASEGEASEAHEVQRMEMPQTFCESCGDNDHNIDIGTCSNCEKVACILCDDFRQCGLCLQTECLECYHRHRCRRPLHQQGAEKLQKSADAVAEKMQKHLKTLVNMHKNPEKIGETLQTNPDFRKVLESPKKLFLKSVKCN